MKLQRTLSAQLEVEGVEIGVSPAQLAPAKGVSIVMGVAQNGWSMMENPSKMDDSGVPLFQEISKCFWVEAMS